MKPITTLPAPKPAPMLAPPAHPAPTQAALALQRILAEDKRRSHTAHMGAPVWSPA